MARLSPSDSPRPWASPAATLLLLIALGPLGAGSASCGRWERAAIELSLASSSVILGVAGARQAQLDGMLSVRSAIAYGYWCWPLTFCSLLAAASLLMWIFDFWLMRHWHGLPADPLLDTDLQD